MEETDASSNVKLWLDLGLGLTKYHRSDLDHAMHSSSSCVDIMQEPEKGTRKNGILGGGCEDDDDMNYFNRSKKKLRLGGDQITLLEDSFRQHSTLTMAQKRALAEKLNLKPRQVEVWFQNRRARTKLKKNEIDCELLKKKFERLSEENRRLQNQMLGSAAKIEKTPPQTSAAATAPSPLQQLFYGTCSSCQKLLKSGGGKKEAAAVDAATEVTNED